RYEEGRRRDPTRADPWLGFGALALDRRDYSSALDCARRARALEPERTDARELERLALELARVGPLRLECAGAAGAVERGRVVSAIQRQRPESEPRVGPGRVATSPLLVS